MGIFTRFSDIVNSNLHSILDKAEDPEKMVRLIIQEMEDTLVEVRSTAARTIADRKAVQRRVSHWRHEVADWEEKAELAVSREREDLARAALVEKQHAADQMAALEQEDARLADSLAQLNDDISRLQAKLDDARSRQKSLIQRRQAVSTRLEARKQVHDRRLDDALNRFEGYEQRLDRMEGEAEALDIGRGESGVRQAFRDLEASEAVDSELEALKARVGGKKQARAKKQG